MGILKKIYYKKESNLIIWKIAETLEELKVLADLLGITEFSVKTEKRLKEQLASKILLAQEGLYTRLAKSEFGKPYIKNSDLNISISHDFPFVVLMISKHKCGVDLQTPSPKATRVKHKFINNQDASLSVNVDEYHSLVWSLKESLYKVNGDPMVYFKDHLHINVLNLSNAEAEISHADYKEKLNLKIDKLENTYLTYTCHKL